MSKTLSVALLGACALLAGPLALPSSAAPSAADAATPVVTGLAGPLQVAYRDADDTLLVADAFASTVWEADPVTGEKAPADGGRFAPGTAVTGVDAAAGGFWATITLPAPEGEQGVTRLVRAGADGGRRVVANLLEHELRHNPDGQSQGPGDLLSNPYDVLAVPGGAIVADAAGNDVLHVSDRGRVRTLTVLPVSRRGACADVENNGVAGGGCDPVPTGLDLGPDGSLYVSGLGAEVEGHVWKIDRSTGKIARTWRGLPPLTGIAVDRHGNVYGSSLFGSAVVRITPGGQRSTVEVPGPTGLEVHDGRLYAGTLDLGGGPGSVVAVDRRAF